MRGSLGKQGCLGRRPRRRKAPSGVGEEERGQETGALWLDETGRTQMVKILLTSIIS